MGLLDALFGRPDDQQPEQPAARQPRPLHPKLRAARPRPQNADEHAVARYRYMLQTAPPEELERAHEEAFARLSPEQRQLALQHMAEIIPPGEARDLTDEPGSLARAATRAEIRQPGFMERSFGGANARGNLGGMAGGLGGGMGGMGMGGMLAGGLLTSIAGGFIGSSIANSFFSHSGHEQGFQSSPEAQAVEGGVTDYADSGFDDSGLQDASTDPYGDPGADFASDSTADFGSDSGLADASSDPYGDPADAGSYDAGFNSSDAGGDFGGGDFGGDI